MGVNFKRTPKELGLLQGELKRVSKQESKLISKAMTSQKSAGVTGAIRDKVPDKALAALEKAFQKGFFFLLEKGDPIIEKTGGLEKTRQLWQIYKASLDIMIIPETLKAIDKCALQRTRANKGFSTAEGSALGIFGIGMPDIPVFLAVVLKLSYEIAASYGIDYRDPKERKYTLELLKFAFSSGKEKQLYSESCDLLAMAIDIGDYLDTTITPDDVETVAQVLATDMLVYKFIQGLTFVGVVGGPLNYMILSRVSKVAKIKYKKRFLSSLTHEVKSRL